MIITQPRLATEYQPILTDKNKWHKEMLREGMQAAEGAKRAH
jgi:hypothetical protein